MTWLLVCDQISSIDLCAQDYKSLRTAVMTCATPVNSHIDSF